MTIGVTGHQLLGDNDVVNWLTEELSKEIALLHPTRAYSCLAIGADQIFAKLIVERKIPLISIIPSQNYHLTFDEIHKTLYRNLRQQSSEIITLQYKEPSEEAYMEAGKTIVGYSDTVFAIWDGLPAKGLGGTGDIVGYAMKQKRKIIHLNPVTKIIKKYNYGT